MKRFFKINFGVFIMAVGLYVFLIPQDLAVGGVTGLAMVVNNFFPIISVGLVMIIANIVLFILAFIVIGKDFGGYTIYSSLLLSGMIYLFEMAYPISQPLVDDLMINLIYGVIIQGIGMGIIFYENASTGGTDIIAKIITKFVNMEIGKALLLADFLIVMFAGISFGLTLGLYALLGVIVNAGVIDNVIAGLNRKMQLLIITDKTDEINEYIINEIQRGTTLYTGKGGFSGAEKVIISTIVSKREYIKIKQYSRAMDDNVFISIGFVNEVLGNYRIT